MIDKRIDWYISMIRDDLERLRDGRFTGNVEFRVNIKNGGIANMNNGLHKSLKMPEGYNA